MINQETTTPALGAITPLAGGKPEIVPIQLAPPEGTDILVDIQAVGICHADVAASEGDFPVAYPTILGHEGVGIVRAVGPQVRRLAPDQRVILTYDSCGMCQRCTSGHRTQCLHYMERNFPSRQHPRSGITADGLDIHGGFFGQSSFATVARASERNAVKVDTTLPASLLAPLGCGIQTGTGAILNVAHPRPDQSVLIVGLGAVGIAAALAAKTCGVRSLIVVDINEAKLTLASELGVPMVINALAENWKATVQEMTSGSLDIAIECSGNPRVIGTVLECLTPGGTAVILGVPPFGTPVALDIATIVNKSLFVRGSVEGDSRSQDLIPHLVREVESGHFPMERLITEFAFKDLTLALESLDNSSIVKPVLLMPERDT